MPAVRGHDDQVAVLVVRGINNRLMRMFVLHIHHVAAHVLRHCRCLHLVEAFVRKGAVSLYRTIFPQMTFWLPEDEAAQLRFEFETGLARLETA